MTLKEDIQDELEQLKADGVQPSKLTALEDMVEMLPDDVREASKDARAAWSPGDEVDVIVEDDGSGTRHGDPMARTPEGLVVFMKMPDDMTASRGEHFDVILSTVKSRMARGIPALKFDEADVEAEAQD